MGTWTAFGRVEGAGLLCLFGPSPDRAADPRDSEYVCSGESAAPTVKAERNVSSSPVCEAVSEVRPPGGGFCVPESRPGTRVTVDTRTDSRDALSQLGGVAVVGLADGMPSSLAILPRRTCTRRRRTLANLSGDAEAPSDADLLRLGYG